MKAVRTRVRCRLRRAVSWFLRIHTVHVQHAITVYATHQSHTNTQGDSGYIESGKKHCMDQCRPVPDRLPESLCQSPVYAVWSRPTTRYGIRWCCATCWREHRLPRTVQRLGLHPIETLIRSAWTALHARAQGMAQSLETIPAAAARRPAGPSEGAPRVRRPGGCTRGRGSR